MTDPTASETPGVAGVRREPRGALIFCRTTMRDLRRGQRVVVADGAEQYLAIVAIAPRQIVISPPLDDAPRVLEVQSEAEQRTEHSVAPSGVTFLAADDGEVGLRELVRAVALAALPLPAMPPLPAPTRLTLQVRTAPGGARAP